MLLSKLQVGASADIVAVYSEESMRRRLQELGFLPGKRIECILRSPLGDPAAYRICGTTIAVRNRDADKIEIKTEVV